MKKIGIVSRIHGINYGANLQAVALQNVLQELGVSAEYINFEVAIPPANCIRQILSWGYSVARRFLGFRKRIQRTENFQKLYLNLSPVLLDRKALQEYSQCYDVLMAGSDQIWNPRYYPLSAGLYLLSFRNNCLKISYASSFGIKTFPDNLKQIYKKQLKKFKAVSVREKDGACILEEMGMKAIQTHIDPTLLMDAEQWRGYFENSPLIQGDYICCYVMSGADKLNDYILLKAKELQGMLPSHPRIVVLGEKEYKGLFSSIIFIRTAGPAEYLNYMYYAQYVLTSSFHGTCFSIIFRKNFYSILSAKNKFNSRIENLLNLFSLENRMYYQEEDRNLDATTISFESVSKIIADERNRSLEYLKQIL